MGTFNSDDGFTTGFLGDKKKNSRKVSNNLSSLFDDQSLNLSDTQRIRTFNQQSTDPESITFDSGRSRSFNNAPKFNDNQVFADNSVPKQWQNNNQSTFNQQMPMPKQQAFDNQNNGFNQMQPINVENQNEEIQQIQPNDFVNSNDVSGSQPVNMNQSQPMNINNQQPVEFESAPQVPESNNLTPNPDIQNINVDSANNTGAKLSEKKKKDLTKILNISSIAILTILIIFVVLISTGVIGSKKNKNVVEKVEVNTEEQKIEGMVSKLNAACNHLDTEGNYGSKPAGVDESCKDITCFIVDNVICANGLCIISDAQTVYSKTCNTGSIRRINANDFQASINLGDLCETILTDPSLAGELKAEYGSCQNFLCETTVKGKTYTQVCKGNS